MEMKFRRFIHFYLILLIVNFTGESDVIGSHEPVTATVGQDVILPCHLEPPFDISTLTVEWKQGAKLVHRYRSGADHFVDQGENYKNRTSLFREEMTKGNISLKLSKVKDQDEGSYTCYVPKLESQVKRGNVNLIVDRYNRSQSVNTPDGTGLSTGAIAGAVIGSVIGILVIAGIMYGLWCVWKKQTNRGEDAGDGGRRQDNREDDNQEAIPLKDLGNNAEVNAGAGGGGQDNREDDNPEANPNQGDIAAN